MAVTVKVSRVQAELERLDKEAKRFINSATRLRALQALAELKRTTPVDTGRARNSWIVTTSPTKFVNTLGNVSQQNLLQPPSEQRIEQYYITNGVPYIQDLNEGSSRQAPPRFIEQAVSQFFSVEGLVYTEV